MLNRQGRPTGPGAAEAASGETFTGNRGLAIEEALIFEIGRTDTTGVDLPEPAKFTLAPRRRSSARRRSACRASPSREAVRHYVRLSQKNYAIDTGLYPLGSCTMKHNPRLNEKMARLPGFADIHPLQPLSTVQGALELIDELAHWLTTLTGMPAVAHVAQGRRPWRAVRHDGDQGGASRRAATQRTRRAGARIRRTAPIRRRRRCSAITVEVDAGARRRHASISRRSRRALGARRRRDHAHQPQHLRPVRARRRRDRRGRARGRRLLLLRRRQLQRHRRQGAAGRPRRRRHAHQPAQDLLDAARRRRSRRRARWCCRRRWRPSRPLPLRRSTATDGCSPGRERRGRAGQRQAVRPHDRLPRPDGHVRPGARLHARATAPTACARSPRTRCSTPTTSAPASRDVMTPPFGDGPCMHEALFDDRFLEGHRRHHARLRQGDDRRGLPPDDHVLPAGRAWRDADRADRDRIARQSLDLFIATLRVAGRARPRRGDAERFKEAPRFAPRRRLDETQAARKPRLRWTPPVERKEAAE